MIQRFRASLINIFLFKVSKEHRLYIIRFITLRLFMFPSTKPLENRRSTAFKSLYVPSTKLQISGISKSFASSSQGINLFESFRESALGRVVFALTLDKKRLAERVVIGRADVARRRLERGCN
jgi:hypothetical protein